MTPNSSPEDRAARVDDLTAAIDEAEKYCDAAEAGDYRFGAFISNATIRKLIAAARASQEAAAERDALIDVLRRNGFVPCDIPACNCGSWHARYGLPERWEEIKDALAEADHPLCNANGNSTLRALHELVAERDALRKDAERYRFLRSPLAAEGGPVQRELWQEMGVKLCREGAMDREVDAAMRLLAAAIAASAPDKETT